MTTRPLTAARRWLPARLPFYYGWIMLPVAILAMVATSPGQTFVVSVFNPSFREVLGLTHSQLTGAYMAGTLLAALPQPYFGTLMDRTGIRRMMTIVVLLFGLACFFTAQTRTIGMLFLSFLTLRMLGQGALGLLAGNTLAMWFQDRLGTASGLMNVGVSLAVAFVPPGVLLLIQGVGWRSAYVLLGAAVWALMLPLLAFLYHNRPEDVGQALDGAAEEAADEVAVPKPRRTAFDLPAARRTRAYWILLAATTAWGMIATGVFFNIIPLFAESGLSETAAAATFTLLSIAMGLTQLVGGYLADRVGLNWLTAVSMAFLALGVWVLIALETIGFWHLYPVLFGIGQGLIAIVGSTVWARYYGRAHLGRIRGSVWTFNVAGTSVGPFIMGLLFDWTGGYRASLVLFLALLMPLAVAAVWATSPTNQSLQKA